MELQIIDRIDNPLLERTEVRFRIHHNDGGTPRRSEVREALAEELKVARDSVIIHNLISHFGRRQTDGYAKVYADHQRMIAIEREYLLKRHNLAKPKRKAKGGS